MPSKQTENYHLSQWEKTDKVLMEDFNADNVKIDAALAGKADTSALESLKQTVSGHTSALNGKGNCRIYTQTYTGNGNSGTDGTVKLTFPGKPLLVVLVEPKNGMFSLLMYGTTYGYNIATSGSMYMTWTENSVSWYHPSTFHFNTKGYKYTAIAFLAAS